MAIPFLKKITLPAFQFFSRKPENTIGIDIGSHSTKVIQLRYESERAVLETYGELKNEGYLKSETARGISVTRYSDADLASLLQDLLREANVTSKEAVFSIPATSSFTTTITFPRISPKEIASSIPLEARKYIPIPLGEVVLDWDILETGEERDTIEVLLVAIPREIVEKFQRVSALTKLNVRALEVETFSLVRALVGRDLTPTALINFGHISSTVAIVDKGKLRLSHNLNRGSHDLTRALERGLGVTIERAEAMKRDIGLSAKEEEREIASIMAPLIETLFADIDTVIRNYNRKSPRKIQKINLTGGGSQLKGIIEVAATRFGVEVLRGNPFARIVAPAFMQMIFREIGPSFSTATGLALHEITPQ